MGFLGNVKGFEGIWRGFFGISGGLGVDLVGLSLGFIRDFVEILRGFWLCPSSYPRDPPPHKVSESPLGGTLVIWK